MQKLFGYEIYEYDSLESTNTLLFERAKQGEKDKTVIVARHQTGGRGRRGKSFFSPNGTGLYMSLLTRKALSLDTINYLTPAVAVAVAKAIESVADKKCGIKWVNDIYIEGKKVAGILTETKYDFKKGELCFAVIGIGINLTVPKGDFPDELKNIAAAVFEECCDDDRTKMMKEVILNLDGILNNFDPKRFMNEYRSRSILDGKEITVASPDGEVRATAIEVDDEARLVIKVGGEKAALSSGEVSIRLE